MAAPWVGRARRREGGSAAGEGCARTRPGCAAPASCAAAELPEFDSSSCSTPAGARIRARWPARDEAEWIFVRGCMFGVGICMRWHVVSLLCNGFVYGCACCGMAHVARVLFFPYLFCMHPSLVSCPVITSSSPPLSPRALVSLGGPHFSTRSSRLAPALIVGAGGLLISLS